ncbi:MAG: hypothetical protein ACOX0J_12935 [Thermoactinomyces vulgaris]
MPHRRRRRRGGCQARVNNGATTGAQSAGLINLNLQIPINLGDAQTICGGSGNSTSNLL